VSFVRNSNERKSSVAQISKSGFRLAELVPCCPVRSSSTFEEATMGRGILLWLLGVPIPVIILLWLFFGR